MTPQQRRLIRELVKKYSEHVGTESLIAFVADTNGMLAAGRALLQSIETGDSAGTDWLFRDCLQHNVVFHSFIEEINRLIAIFDPSRDKEDHFTTLGISPGAGRDEIKQAYRALSLQYHPDTASPQHRDKPEKFIAINKAYQALMTAQYLEEGDEKSTSGTQWRKNRSRKLSSGHKKKLFGYASAALVVLAIVSTVASINIKNRAMLTGLQRGARPVSAFSIPPATKTVTPTTLPEPVPDNPISPQKPLPALQTVQTEQPPAQTLIITDNAKLPDTQKIPVIKETAAPLPAQKPPAMKPSVVHLTKQHLKRKSAQAEPSVLPPADTPPVEKEIKIVTIPYKNTHNQVAVSPGVTAALPVTPAKAIEKEQVQPDIQTRIDTFLADYIKAYQQRNLILFSSFFAADAVENGKAFTSMLPIYSKLFATTSDLTLKVEKTSWQQLDGKISFQGSFKVQVQYNDSHMFSGSGPIRFVLLDDKERYRVSILEYRFLVAN